MLSLFILFLSAAVSRPLISFQMEKSKNTKYQVPCISHVITHFSPWLAARVPDQCINLRSGTKAQTCRRQALKTAGNELELDRNWVAAYHSGLALTPFRHVTIAYREAAQDAVLI